MSKYKLIEKMGLSTFRCDGSIVLLADEVEAALQKAAVVYGSYEMKISAENSHGWSNEKVTGDTHQALLICVEPIKKDLDKAEKICDINSVMGRAVLPFFDDIDPKDCRLKITVEKIP